MQCDRGHQCSGGAGGQPLQARSGVQRSEPRRCALCGHDRSEEGRTTEQKLSRDWKPGDGEHDNENNVHVLGIDGLSAWPTFARATASWYWKCPNQTRFRGRRSLRLVCVAQRRRHRVAMAPNFRCLSTTARARCDREDCCPHRVERCDPSWRLRSRRLQTRTGRTLQILISNQSRTIVKHYSSELA